MMVCILGKAEAIDSLFKKQKSSNNIKKPKLSAKKESTKGI